MRCPRCDSENVSYQVDSKVKHSFWWGFKGQTTTYAVCQNCGKRWKRKPFETPTNPIGQPACIGDVHMYNLLISRNRKILGRDLKVKVFIDGVKKAPLADGETQSYHLSKGMHTILLKSFSRSDVIVQLNMEEQSYQINCEMKSNQLEHSVSIL